MAAPQSIESELLITRANWFIRHVAGYDGGFSEFGDVSCLAHLFAFELPAEEASAVASLARSRTTAARRVARARIVWRARQGETPPTIAEALGVSAEPVRRRLRRFNAKGLLALEDHARSGRRPTYSAEQRATVRATALTKPQTLGLPFAAWTLDCLAVYLREHTGIAMRRSRIDEILIQEGLRWRRQETWFGERVDPEFAQGGLRHSPPDRLRAASSSV